MRASLRAGLAAGLGVGLAVGLAAGCGGDGDAETVRVFAAASLGPALEVIAERHGEETGARILLSFAA